MSPKKLVTSLVLASAIAVANAGTVVVNFDDLIADTAVPGGYGGATSWSGGVMDAAGYAVSGPNFLHGSPNIDVTFAAPIIFNGVNYNSWGGAGAYGGGGHSFELFSGGSLVFQGPMDPLTADLGWINSSYGGAVDLVRIYGSGDGAVIDNFTYTTTDTSVPEPASLALMMAGLCLVGLVRRRKD